MSGSDFLFSTILSMSTAAKTSFSETKAAKNPTIFPPDPGVLAQEIVVDLESAFEQFCEIAADFVRNYWVTCQVAVVPGRRGSREDMRDFMWQGWRVVVNYCR